MNAIYELADKIHGSLERVGSRLRQPLHLRRYAVPAEECVSGDAPLLKGAIRR